MLEERCSETSADIRAMDLASALNSQLHFFVLNPSLKGAVTNPCIPQGTSGWIKHSSFIISKYPLVIKMQ